MGSIYNRSCICQKYNPVPNEDQGRELIFWLVSASELAYYHLLHIYLESWCLVHYPRICNIYTDVLGNEFRTRVMLLFCQFASAFNFYASVKDHIHSVGLGKEHLFGLLQCFYKKKKKIGL